MNIPITQESAPLYRCPTDGEITALCVCPKCGDVLGVSNETL